MPSGARSLPVLALVAAFAASFVGLVWPSAPSRGPLKSADAAEPRLLLRPRLLMLASAEAPGASARTAALGSAGAVSPTPEGLLRARRFLAGRRGRTAFAVIDSNGRLHGVRSGTPFMSASVVKAMLLVARLRQASGRPLAGGERALLEPMIRRSGNDEASAVYNGGTGGAALRRLARSARMTRFSVGSHWGSAQVTAADQARLFHRLDALLPQRHRAYGRRLLSSIVREQSWGIPAVARPRWRVFFKGGWRETGLGRLVHQAALLEGEGGRTSIAVLSDGNPSHYYGTATVRGTAAALLAGASPHIEGSVRKARRRARRGASAERTRDRERRRPVSSGAENGAPRGYRAARRSP